MYCGASIACKPECSAVQAVRRSRPSLGREVNESEAAKHLFKQEVLQRAAFYEDGSVAEW